MFERILHATQQSGRPEVSEHLISFLLEVNFEGESTKAMFLLDELDGAMPILEALPHVVVKGLMATPPPTQRSGTGVSLLPSSA